MVKYLKSLSFLAVFPLIAQESLSLEEALRRAWREQAGLQAGEAMVQGRRAQAQAMGSLRLPSISAGAGLTRTNEPMLAFGTKLDQARIAQMDFAPSTLNHPDPITGVGAYVSIAQPLYAGGKLDAARRAGALMADAEGASQSHRRQQVALAVVQAYFGTQVAAQGLQYAEDTLKQARETESFIQARVDQGLMLKSEGDRARAFRAQSEAGVAESRQRLATVRSALALLMGSEGLPENLSTPLAITPMPVADQPGLRADLQSARFQWQAAQENVKAAKGSFKPEVGLTLTAGTARYTWNAGGNWTTASLGAKWNFSFSDAPRVHAAQAQARAAELDLKWQQQQANRDADVARMALEAARAKIESARVALEASESVRVIRTARHREGLLPLVEVLDAESGLSGARTLLLNSELEWRLACAQLALALGQPIEGIKE